MIIKRNLRTFLSFLVFLPFVISCSSSSKTQGSTGAVMDANKELAGGAAQYRVMMQQLPAARFPRNYDPQKQKFETSGSEWWCSGFYPGTLLYLFQETADSSLYAEAMRILKVLEKEKHNTSTHDLGFMMFCSFGHANRIAPKKEFEEILITSARSLATRFNPVTACIKSWDAKASDFLVIIDNMMNLELLFWATKKTGDSSFYKIAVTHANTTMKNHFRSDNSSYHVLNYDAGTGAVKEKRTAQGFSNESAWARGQAWGLYGYTATYRETGDKKYLEQARKIAAFMLDHPNLPADKIPYWDFNAPDIPGAMRDASAGAIAASALLELSGFVSKKERRKYFKAAELMINSLSNAPYKVPAGENAGFIIQHGVGHLPAKSEVDVSLSYGDYYFVEALSRYNNMTRQH